jgi:hypothetical protein
MQSKNTITLLSVLIIICSAIAASIGIFSNSGPGPSKIISVRGHEVNLYGKGVYHDMSAEVAPQGIAQDVVTLFLAIPILLVSLYFYRKGSLRGKIILTGTLAYFLVTYLFFTLMAMYNQLFLLWICLLSFSFFAFILSFNTLAIDEISIGKKRPFPSVGLGSFLMFTSIAIAILWLSIVVPPALSATIPVQVEHYTTLVVQALDLSILLPVSFIAGLYAYRKTPYGYKLALVYIIFLSLLMTALTAKIIAMFNLGYNVFPVIYIIPTFNVVSLIIMFFSLRAIQQEKISGVIYPHWQL